MEARTRPLWIVLATVVVAAPGCQLIQAHPQRHESSPPDPENDPVVVRFPVASQPVQDPLERRVLEFVDRVDQAAHAVTRRTSSGAADAGEPAAELSPRAARRAADDPTRRPAPSAVAAAEDSPAGDAGAADSERDVGAAAAAVPHELATSAPAGPPPTVVRAVAARAASEPATPPLEATVAGVNAPARATTRTATLRALVSSWLSESPVDASFRAQLDARLLHVATGDYAAARAPLSLVSAEQGELASGLIESMIAVREGHLGDPAAAQAAALREIERLSATLSRGAEFEIGALVPCTEVRTFGQYQPIEPARFPAGVANEFVVYCEPRNFGTEMREGLCESRFSMRTRVLRGAEVILDLIDAEIVDRCRSKRRDCFIAKLVALPAQLSPGDYTVKVTLEDRLKNQVAERHCEFRILASP